jgi:hypothetical protein
VQGPELMAWARRADFGATKRYIDLRDQATRAVSEKVGLGGFWYENPVQKRRSVYRVALADAIPGRLRPHVDQPQGANKRDFTPRLRWPGGGNH